MNRLRRGDIIRVVGFVMLAGLDEGVYIVSQVGEAWGHATYTFKRARGAKAVVAHYASSVDPWVTSEDDPNLNKIIIIQKGTHGN